MFKSNKKIIIATGGTGGHIFPSLSLHESLNKKFHIEITTDKRGMNYLGDKTNLRIKLIDSSPFFKKNILKSVISFFKIIIATVLSVIFLFKSKAKLVVGMGGYSSFPVCVAALLLGKKIIIYENNLVLGKTNKILIPFAEKILVSTDSVAGINPRYKNKVFFSGYFLRKNLFNVKKNDGDYNTKDLSLLILGGSQSAKIFSKLVPDVLTACKRENIKFKIYQQCRLDDENDLKKNYKENNFNFELFIFSSDLSKYYEKADIAITRSGASSIAELTNSRTPFIAIPLPSSADNHQQENASYFEKKGYCILLNEKDIKRKLFEILKDLNNDRKKLFLMKDKMKQHSDENSSDKASELIERILNA
tara:strand:+ start:11646 stop:12734 length:1089 start_codon:yes stop_codon:yes gene_type:complete